MREFFARSVHETLIMLTYAPLVVVFVAAWFMASAFGFPAWTIFGFLLAQTVLAIAWSNSKPRRKLDQKLVVWTSKLVGAPHKQ